jgi:hypothetical protein
MSFPRAHLCLEFESGLSAVTAFPDRLSLQDLALKTAIPTGGTAQFAVPERRYGSPSHVFRAMNLSSALEFGQSKPDCAKFCSAPSAAA